MKNCSFFSNTIDYRGSVIRPRKLKIDSHTTDSTTGLKPPTNISELHLSLDLCSVFQQLVLSFTHLAAPLNRNLQKDQPNEFGNLTAEEGAEMKKFKDRMIFSSLLALQYAKNHFRIDTYACNVYGGYILLQKQPGKTSNRLGTGWDSWPSLNRCMTKPERNASRKCFPC